MALIGVHRRGLATGRLAAKARAGNMEAPVEAQAVIAEFSQRPRCPSNRAPLRLVADSRGELDRQAGGRDHRVAGRPGRRRRRPVPRPPVRPRASARARAELPRRRAGVLRGHLRRHGTRGEGGRPGQRGGDPGGARNHEPHAAQTRAGPGGDPPVHAGKAPGWPLERELARLRDALGEPPHPAAGILEIQMEAALADGQLAARRASCCGGSPRRWTSAGSSWRRSRRCCGSAAASAARRAAASWPAALGRGCLPRARREPEASDAEVKLAYRRLMNQHHPDKLRARGMPESMIPIAEAKTREIRAAWDTCAPRAACAELGGDSAGHGRCGRVSRRLAHRDVVMLDYRIAPRSFRRISPASARRWTPCSRPAPTWCTST
jgi:hypothetical protein